MKTTILDYIVATFFISLNLAVSFMAAYYLSRFTRIVFFEYHILVDLFIWVLLYIFLSGLSIRLLLWLYPLKEGTYRMEGGDFFIWKLYTSLNEMGSTVFLPFIPIFLRPLFFKFFGSRIGKNVSIAGRFMEPHMIRADAYAFFGGETIVTAHALTYNELILKPVIIGEKVTVGVGSIVMPGVTIGKNSIIAAGSVIPMDTKIPPNEIWGGVPAKKIKDISIQEAGY
ncbi:MAG: DapH/DapD/GlmU-related protein [Deltaproteobacteria bacterium]|nr:DapH/DapD/GlmU-related protein [Deltaproteobacteria bacterium]